MAKVADPHGVWWSVYRTWLRLDRYWLSSDVPNPKSPLDYLLFPIVGFVLGSILLIVMWPFWFSSHWLGVPWRIAIERDGSEVDAERVRGWRKSQRRIEEIAESVAAGTLPLYREGTPLRRALATGRRLTPEDVHTMAFSEPPPGKRGYNPDEVDAFLGRVEAALRDPTGRILTPEQIGNVVFSKRSPGKRGYHPDEVDAFLDRVAEEMNPRATGKHESPWV